MDPNTKKTCFFCGHALPILLMTYSEQEKLEKQITAAIEKAYQLGYRHFFSSGDLGFDVLAAKLAADFRDSGHPDAEVHLIARDSGRQREWAEMAAKGFPTVFTRANSIEYPLLNGVSSPPVRRIYTMLLCSSLGIFYYDFGEKDHVSIISSHFRYLAEEGMRLVNLWDGFPEEIVFGPRA